MGIESDWRGYPIGTAQIADGAITAAKLAAGAVTPDIANASITNAMLAANAVTEAVTTAGTFTTASIAANAAITGSQLAANTIAESNITAKTITHASLSDTAGVLGSQLGAGTTHVATGSLTFASTTGNITGMTIPAKSLVTDVIAVPTTAFNGTTFSISIEDSGAAGGFLPAMTIANSQLTTLNVAIGADSAARGPLLFTPGVQTLTPATPDFTVTTWPRPIKAYYNGANAVHATISKSGTNSTGALTVYCVYVQLA